MSDQVKLAILTDGGAGNLFVQTNFIYCLYRYLADENVSVIVFGHKSMELNDLLYSDCSFISEYYSRNESERGYEADAYIHLEFFPDVLFERKSVKDAAPKLHDLLNRWSSFMQDMQRRYALMHPFVNHGAYIYAANTGKNVLNILDIDDRIGIDRDYSWHLDIGDGLQYISNLGLKKDEYITFQTGATPDLFLKTGPKSWPDRCYEKLIALLKKVYPDKKIVQLGESTNCNPIDGADLCMLGKTDWKQLGWLLKDAWLHIDGECGMVHYRRALGAGPSVVLFGPTPNDFYGYDMNINIYENVCPYPCARLTDSWLEHCALGIEEPLCMTAITPGVVLEKIEAWDRTQAVKTGDMSYALSFKNEELYKEDLFDIDSEYRKALLDTYRIYHYETEAIRLRDLKVFCVTEGESTFIPLENTAAYKALTVKDGWDGYDRYVKLLNKRDNNTIHSLDRFKELVGILDSRGLDDRCPLLVDGRDRIMDGQHRAAWIASRFGLDLMIHILRIYKFGDEHFDLVPYDKLSRGERVVIYGAGGIGESYIKQMDETRYANVIALLDRNPDRWNSYPEKRGRITCFGPEKIRDIKSEFDHVLVASRGGKHIPDIVSNLLQLGIERERIVSYATE